MRRMMRAVRVAAPGPPSVLEVHPVPVPAPGPREVLVRVRAVGINPVETYIRSGAYARGPAGWPYTPGNDAAGEVVAVGGEVSMVKPGDRVYTLRCSSGAYAEEALAEERFVRPLPPASSWEEGACLGVPFFTAYRALFQKLHIKPGKTILVHGATGGVGTAALQMARAHGLRVLGTSGSEAGSAAIAPLCDAVLTHGRGEAIVADVLAATDSKGADFVLENAAHSNLGLDCKMLAQGGAICVVGSRGDVSITPRDLMAKEGSITAVMLFSASEEDLTESAAYIEKGLAAGLLRPVVGKVFEGLEAAPAAHEEVIAHAGGSTGKVVIRVT